MYMIPKNVNAKYEIFPGFGMFELLISLVGAGIGAALFYLVKLLGVPLPLALFIGIIFPVTAFFSSMNDPRTGMSLILMLKHFRQYKDRQKKYFYVFGSGRLEDA